MQERNSRTTIVGGMMIVLFYLTWCMLTKSYSNNSFLFGAMICLTGVMICYLYLQRKVYANESISTQMHGINVLILTGFLFILVGNALNNQLIWLEVFVSGLIVIMTAFIEIIWLRKLGVDKYKKNAFNMFKRIFCNWEIMLVLVLFSLLSVHTGGSSYKWDSGLYYTTCQDIKLFSIGSQAIYGHIAQTFGFLMKVGNVIWGNVYRAAYFMNLLMACISFFAFYGILRYVFPLKGRKVCAIGSAIYAFCPFVLGLVNYLSLDYYCGTLFVALVYVTLKEKWIYHFAIAFAFCFTKEPAIVIYGVFCATIVILNEVNEYKRLRILTLKSMVRNYLYWYMVLIGSMWVATYVLLGPWNAGEGGLLIDGKYILSKLKVLYMFNFQWIFTALALGAIVIVARNGNEKLKKLCILLIFPQIAFTLFSCIFKTVNHYRYTDITAFTLILLGVIFVLMLRKEWCVKLGMAICLVLSLTMSYSSIDPLSRVLFTTVSTGNGEMFSTGEKPSFGDMTIYNKQMLGMENALNRALSDAIEDNSVILFELQQDNLWYFDGMSGFEKLDGQFAKTLCYWDDEKKQRCMLNSDEAITLDIYHVSNKDNLEDVVQMFPEGTVFNYIRIDDEDDEIINTINEKYSEKSNFYYDRYNWRINRVCFRT